MPETERPDYRRFELFVPRDLWAAAEARAGKRNVTTWVCRLMAREVGMTYEPKPPGRPPKAVEPAAKRKPARKRGGKK